MVKNFLKLCLSVCISSTPLLAQNHQVNLTWVMGANTTASNVYRCIGTCVPLPGAGALNTTPLTVTSYTDSLVLDGSTYSYCATGFVTLTTGPFETACSNVVTAIIPTINPPPRPAAPTGLADMVVPISPTGPPPGMVSIASFGTVGTGGDDTIVFQNAINTTASKMQTLEIIAGNYNVNTLTFPNNASIYLDSGATVTAITGFVDGQHLLEIHSTNVTINGASAANSIFHMRKSEYTSGEQRHCLNVQNASNVTISNISCNDSGGDGLYVRASTNVTVSDSIFNNNRRQGSSVTGQVNHIHYLRDQFTNTSGTAPQSGVDIEPNSPADFLQDVTFADCYMTGNAADGLLVSLWQMSSASLPVSITALRNHTAHNGQMGYRLQNASPTNAPGAILIQDSFSTDDGIYGAVGYFYAANGASATFQNLTVVDPHINGPSVYHDNAAVAVARGGGGTVADGNVHFLNTNITITNGKTDHYFNFFDGSGIGAQNVQFTIGPGGLSGATAAPPNGFLNGTAVQTVP